MKHKILLVLLVSLAISGIQCLAPSQGSKTKSAVDVGKGPRFQVEKMARVGGNTLADPFKGVMLYGNGDNVSVEYNFPTPGRYSFEITGASNNDTDAGITVYVGETPGTTVFFDTREAQNKTAYADVEKAGPQKVSLTLTSDIGQNDTYLDTFLVKRHADLMGPPVLPTKGAFETGVYRNMFNERGYPKEEIQAKVKAVYDQLFHGDINNEAVMFDAGGNQQGKLAYIMDIGNGDVRSEGMSYGMMIALQMDRKDDFDAIWNWARTYMYQDNAKHPCYGYFSWQMKTDGKPMDEMPAPDGEEYFIMALMFASHRWGDGEGVYAYSKHALEILDRIKNRGSVTGNRLNFEGTSETTGVALMNPEHKMIRFSPDTQNFPVNGDHSNPSYHLPAFYELWALWGPKEDKAYWQEAAQVSRDYFHKAAHPTTGLTPEYANFDGTPVSASFNKGSNNFRWDAWRTAMNWGMDQHWFAKDPKQQELTNRLHKFFASEGILTHRQLYTLDGKPFGGEDGKWHSTGLAATNGASALASTDKLGWQFVDAVWGTPTPTGTWRYYDGMLLMFGLLHLSGNYQIYGPDYLEKQAAAAKTADAPAKEEGAEEKKEEAAAEGAEAEKKEGDDKKAPEKDAAKEEKPAKK